MALVKEQAVSTSILTRLSRRIRKFTSRPIAMYRFFILMNMIPGIGLLFTEPLTFGGKILLIFLPLSVYMFVYVLIKRIGLTQLILIPVLVLHAFQLVLFYLFGESVIAVDMFLNLPTTNATEAGELLGSLWPAIILVCVLYIPTIIFAYMANRDKVNLPKPFRVRMMIISAGLFMVLILIIPFVKKSDPNYLVKVDVYPVNVLYNCKYAIEKWHKSAHYLETSKDFTFNAKRSVNYDEREIYVLVIGEASRASNWSLYGYERNTNPNLSNTDNLIVFTDALTQSNTTHKSVPLFLSAANATCYDSLYTNKSVTTAFKEAGFKTIFVSNQTPNRSFTDYFAEEADVHVNIRRSENGSLISLAKYDTELLPVLKEQLDVSDENLFVIFHTYGSHFNYKERYPESFAQFKPDDEMDIKYRNKTQLINGYDNSVLYTDFFLYSLIEMLKETDACATMFFMSDHGEDLLDDSRKKFLHASPIPTYYQLHVPAILWMSEKSIELKPYQFEVAKFNANAPISTSAVFHTMLNMAEIETGYFNEYYSIVSPRFKRQARYYLNDHDLPENYYEVGLKKQDKEQVRLRGLDTTL